ncbi:MAG: ABC transporter ATP-binding protein [Firmicutes bacterium]|nr:ABC transporter ATP-binding protein [Bacillota bacterium]
MTGYGSTVIVHGVSLRAEEGQIVSIIGPNGAGKSTLLKAVAGQLRKQSGRVLLRGEDVSTLSHDVLARRGIGFVPQNRDVFPSLTVEENLEMGGYLLPPPVVRERKEEVLSRFPQLRPALHRRASTLSGGERKMLGVGRVLMMKPDVLLLDEPSAGLSPEYTQTLLQHIVQLAKEGNTVVMVEQHAAEALSLADWAYVLVAGATRHEGPGRMLLENEDIGAMFLGK